MATQTCSPWITPDQLCCEGDGTTSDCAGGTTPLAYKWTDEQLIQMASNFLFARTCYLYPGLCTVSVWPCVRGCCSQRHPCAICCRYDAVVLPTDYEVFEITSITFDGFAQDLTNYRLDNYRTLVKLDGPWPRNSFGAENTMGTDVIITYTYGRMPPPELQRAAADFACELKKACNGQACALPPHVERISRSNIELSFTDLTKLLQNEQTGIPSVDYALSVHGKCSDDNFYDPFAPYLGMQVGTVQGP